MNQPEPIDIDIPVMNGAVMYSMMDEFTLTRLRNFIDELIKWKADGNPCHIATYEYLIGYKREDIS